MLTFDPSVLKKLYIPPSDSHKGQNGKLLVIGGSSLFHAASLWALEISSKLLDMVFYSSVPQNNQIVQKDKYSFRNGIVVSRDHLEDYIHEADAILIGPGMMRADKKHIREDFHVTFLHEVNLATDEGIQTYLLTRFILHKYPKKRYILDAGALQMMDKEWLRNTPYTILTPHPIEFKRLFDMDASPENIEKMAKEYNTIIVVKGMTDVVCSSDTCVMVPGGNAGMTKGGTGDVLAGLIASLATKNELFLAASCGSFINKKAGESLYKKIGLYFNASDLVKEIPVVMKELLMEK